MFSGLTTDAAETMVGAALIACTVFSVVLTSATIFTLWLTRNSSHDAIAAPATAPSPVGTVAQCEEAPRAIAG